MDSKKQVAIFLAILVLFGIIFYFSTKKRNNQLKNEYSTKSTQSYHSNLGKGTLTHENRNFSTIHSAETETQSFRPIRKALIAYSVPPHYDARIKYGRQNIPNSSGILGCISEPFDQGNCGSSWAFAVAGVVSDRLRIQSSVPSSYGMVLMHDNLSPLYLMQQGNQCSQLKVLMKSGKGVDGCNSDSSCQAGTTVLAFKFIKDSGCIGMRNDSNVDSPAVDTYKINEFYSACLNIGGQINHYFFPGQRQIKAETRWSYKENNENCMKEIMERGPLVSCMNIYSDFLDKYKYGIKNDDVYYQPPGAIPKEGSVTKSGIKFLGTQAVSIIGWGEKKFYSETVQYWIVRLTWGNEWNGDGYVKVIRGENCCNIELEMLGCWGYEILSSLREDDREPFFVSSLNVPKSTKVLLDA